MMHGDVRTDDYFWMRERSNPGVMEYIEAENRYAREVMKHTEGLQKKLFEELRSKTIETDVSVPEKRDEYYYYTRTEAGKQYPIYCRKKGALSAKEEIMLDVNRVAEGNSFLSIGTHKVSPDHKLMMYLADTDGSETYTLFVKDLRSGRLLPERITNTSGAEWANDNRTIFYSTLNDEHRAYKVFRHELGTDPKDDVEVYHEKDPSFYYLVIAKTKSKAFITITLVSATTSEVHYVSADRPGEELKLMRPRKPGVLYLATHFGDRFFIVTNEDAINFKIVQAPDSSISTETWEDLVPHRENVSIDVSDFWPFVEPFKDRLAIFERENAQGRIRVLDLRDMSSHIVEFPERIYMAYPVENPDPGSEVLRIKYFSRVTPNTVYDYDLNTRQLVQLKQDTVPGYDPADYVQDMVYATAEDGKKIPITLVHRREIRKDGRNPAYLFGYGAYATFEWAHTDFDYRIIPLLERGFVCAHAHVRGGGELGRGWHEDGRMLRKMNSFTDFIACAEHLINEGYTSSDKLAITGGSAGGLLIGAVTNMRPDLFKVVVMRVPFVDVLTTMADPTIPNTAGEFEEWGNSNIREHYLYMKQYSPYDRIERKNYPNMLVTAGLNDTRVCYWEPVKYVAKLRAAKTDDNLLLLKTGLVEGHFGASGRYDSLRSTAFDYAFILDRLGMSQ